MTELSEYAQRLSSRMRSCEGDRMNSRPAQAQQPGTGQGSAQPPGKARRAGFSDQNTLKYNKKYRDTLQSVETTLRYAGTAKISPDGTFNIVDVKLLYLLAEEQII